MSHHQPALADFAPAPFFDRVRAYLPRSPPTGGEVTGDHVLNPGMRMKGAVYRDAAVLIPVVARLPGATVLLTQRTPDLPSHAGQVSFPGGKVDRDDADVGAAALREAREEIGLGASFVDITAYLDPYLTATTRYRIWPVIGRVDPDHRLSLNRREVEDVFEVPLSFLMRPENHRRVERSTLGHQRVFYEMPYEGHYIWGATAGIIRGLYERLFA
jgi:8-oxo-dGTP pyrophosphatase MutT (NUDIX family)